MNAILPPATNFAHFIAPGHCPHCFGRVLWNVTECQIHNKKYNFRFLSPCRQQLDRVSPHKIERPLAVVKSILCPLRYGDINQKNSFSRKFPENVRIFYDFLRQLLLLLLLSEIL